MITHTQPLTWPTKADYDLAIKNWKQSILDPTISSGTLSQDNMGIHRFGGANLYVNVYKIGNWMIRCFCSNPPRQPPNDIVERYKAIGDFCAQHRQDVSALLPVTFIERGIKVQSQVFPIVKMPFLTHCPALGDFIAEHYHEKSTMEALSQAWLRMINEMEHASFAHGDLDLTNVLVEQSQQGLLLRLIDYDNVWIPALDGYPQTEHGHAPFQHPHFLPPNPRPYDALMDRFSALVIYISLRALSTNPELYDEWGADESERLLFSENDYKIANLVDGRIAQLISRVTDIELRGYIQVLAQSLRTDLMPPALSNIAQTTMRISLTTSRPTSSQTPTIQPPPIALWGQQVYTVGQTFWNTPIQSQPNGQHSPDDTARMYNWATPAAGNTPPNAPVPLYANTPNSTPQKATGANTTTALTPSQQRQKKRRQRQQGGTNTTTALTPSQGNPPVHSMRRIILTAVLGSTVVALIIILVFFFFVLRPMGIVP